MKRLALASAILLSFASSPLFAQQAQPSSTLTQPRASPHDTISGVVGGRNGNRVTIVYGRPFTADPNTKQPRKIWGGLVPWGQVWRMGSDEATLLITQQPIQIGDTLIPAGAYTLDMLPVENGPSKLIVNKSIGQWGIPYNDALVKTELGRMDITKKETLDKPVDEFTITVTADAAAGPNAGIIKLSWETTAYSIPFTVKKPTTAPATPTPAAPPPAPAPAPATPPQ